MLCPLASSNWNKSDTRRKTVIVGDCPPVSGKAGGNVRICLTMRTSVVNLLGSMPIATSNMCNKYDTLISVRTRYEVYMSDTRRAYRYPEKFRDSDFDPVLGSSRRDTDALRVRPQVRPKRSPRFLSRPPVIRSRRCDCICCTLAVMTLNWINSKTVVANL